MQPTPARLIAILLTCLASLPWPAAAQSALPDTTAVRPMQEIRLPARGQQALPLSGTPVRIAVDSPEIADVRILPPAGDRNGAVMLIAGQPGTTRLQVWLRGQAQPEQWRIHVANEIEQALPAGPETRAQVAIAGQGAVLSGTSASLQDHQQALAATQGANQTVDASVIDVGSMVQVEVKVVELNSSVMKEVGIDWSGGRAGGSWSFAGRVGQSNSASRTLMDGFKVIFGGSRHFRAELDLLQANSLARVLAEPTLVALSGQSASFLSGGEIPIPTSAGLGTQTVEYKPFGIGLTVSPTVLSGDRIFLKVAPEASELDYANAIQVSSGEDRMLLPALRTRKADTTIELGHGESFIISGLVSRQTIANVNKLPFLGDLPVIGTFFRSMRYNQTEMELVIVVTPRLVRPIARNVPIPLPGQDRDPPDTIGNAWGQYLLGAGSSQVMPGFSR